MHDFIIRQMSQERTKIEYTPSLIFRMREIGAAQMDEAADKYYKAREPMEIVTHYENGLFDVYVVSSGPRLYEIARLGFWFLCTCKDFEYSHDSACKHVFMVFPVVCRVCLTAEVPQHGKTCEGCKRAAENEAADKAPYLKPSGDYKPQKIGSVRV